jgi:hypothetical protein
MTAKSCWNSMDTIADYLCSPDITIDAHVRRSQILLGEALAQRRVVYLDTKYWILLREAAINAECVEAVELLGLLRTGVSGGHLFCPISESVFIELMKQSDPASRLATATLIDELSLGAALINQKTRIATEIAHFIHASKGLTNLYPLKHLVWCKLSYALGVLHPTKTAVGPAVELAIQKALFDHMWTIPLREMVTMIGDSGMPVADQSDVAASLNARVAEHANELRRFEQAYAAEVRGIVDLVGGRAVDIMMAMALNDGGILKQPTAQQRRAAENQFKNLFAVALEQGKARDALPTIHILASLHASLRWNKGRKFKSNDLFDFDHAAAALAYGDAFFTERSLCTMVAERHLALDRMYGCHVTADLDNAIAWASAVVEG